MKYPFDPAILDALPEGLAELFRGLEDTLLTEICSRLNMAGKLNEVTVQDIRALRSHGIDLDQIKKAIKKTANISHKELDTLLNDVVERNQVYYTDLIDLAHITQPETLVSAEDIASIMMQTQDEVSNITRSMAFLVDNGRTKLPPAKAYQWALDSALLQVQSGAVSYNEAIRGAVKQLSDSGLKVVQYESGHTDQVDVAARRAVMTGVSQLCAKYTEQTADWLETPYFEVSAHAGARDKPGPSPWSSHKDWQGKVYSTRTNDIYHSIYEVCGLGYVDGLEGANCRHIRSVWVEGVSERTYTDEELANIDKPPFAYEGKQYTTYEATQKQRQIERTIRKLKREKAAYHAVGDTEAEQATNIRIRRLSGKYTEFSKAAGLREQRERMRVVYPESTTIGEIARKPITVITDKAIDKIPTVTPSTIPIDGKSLQSIHKKLLRYARDNNSSKEVAFTYSGDFQRMETAVGEDREVNPIVMGMGDNLFVAHNHPRNSSFSGRDIRFLLQNDVVLGMSVVKNNGGVELLEKTFAYNRQQAVVLFARAVRNVDTENAKLYNKAVEKFINNAVKGGLLTWTKN